MEPILNPKWQVFIKVAEAGSLSRAATTMNIPQSTVSRYINKLESECGCRLFRRTGRGVELSEFGIELLPRIRALAENASRLADDIQSTQGQAVGEVRVGLLPSCVPLFASKLFALVRDRYPKVHLHLVEGASTVLEEQINDGRVDMAVLLREGDTPSRDEFVLLKNSLKLVGQKNDPRLQVSTIALKSIQGLPLIVPSRPHPLRARLDHLSNTKDLHFDCKVEADSIRLQHEMVAAGAGYAITSGMFEINNDNRFDTAKIGPPYLTRCIVLAVTLRRPHTLATKKIQHLIESEVPALLQEK